MANTQTYAFWQFLTKYQIIIPKIQRDYAQGRKDKKTEIIRKNILEAFNQALERSNSKVNLDFVYGSIKGQIIIPLDGQQRLTTLFLLHWYLATISTNLNDDNKEILLKFTYETRLSSGRFCKALITNSIEVLPETETLSKEIIDKTWFYSSWKKDPTVNAMLTMIDAIHEKFKNKAGHWYSLTTESPITFEFLPLNNFQLTDELYVKMNARGKGLSDFENFKAWLDEQLENDSFGIIKKGHWSSQLDTTWTDLFWNNDNGDFSIDEEMMNFFKGMALFQFVANGFDENHQQADLEKAKKIYENTITYLTDYSKYISNDEFSAIMFSSQTFQLFDDIVSFLDYYSENDAKIIGLLKEVSFWKDGAENLFLQFIQKPTFSDRVLFYGLFYWTIKNKADFNDFEFKRFFRVLRNLTANTDINASNLTNVIVSVNELIKSLNVLAFLQDDQLKLTGFDGYQVNEEKLKASLINSDKTWENKLVQIENHKYFAGQISFILEFSKTGTAYDSNLFDEYSQKAMTIFDEEKGLIMDHDFIFHRALLSEGDYLIPVNSNYSFCKFRDEWRTKVFKDTGKSELIKNIFARLQAGNEKTGLVKIIEESSVDDWREGIIKYPHPFQYCEKGQIRWESETDILLLSKISKRGYYKELFTFIFYLQFLEKRENEFLPFMTNWHYDGTGNDELSCAVIDKWKIAGNNECKIDIYYEENTYQLVFKSQKDLPVAIHNILIQSFDIKDGSFFKQCDSDPFNTVNIIKKICASLI
ncbi:MAG: DUF262 domain-containing protein [Bacteroidetes bacterium]|nr:DUF262 domain-containing protein [Bacteroidota bacterium]